MSKLQKSDPHIALDVELTAALQKFIEHRDVPPSPRMTDNDAVNVIVRDWLTGQGFLELPEAADDVTPALEAARVP